MTTNAGSGVFLPEEFGDQGLLARSEQALPALHGQGEIPTT
ncbi:MAG TPA: hypothetical protein VFA74_17815 [Terriglobales bacterium]|nr:hypothetical protein [Terriglobales bacterium]